jgi:hypothetical protein
VSGGVFMKKTLGIQIEKSDLPSLDYEGMIEYIKSTLEDRELKDCATEYLAKYFASRYEYPVEVYMDYNVFTVLLEQLIRLDHDLAVMIVLDRN